MSSSPGRPILRVGGDRHPRLHLWILKSAVKVTGLWGRRGFGRLGRVLGRRVFGQGNYADLAIAPDCLLRLYLFDGYWSYLLFPDYQYEPEIWWLLEQVADMEGLSFLDCGANVGYWSLLAEKQFRLSGRIVAIEGSPLQFHRLIENCELNQAALCTINAGVWSHENASLTFATDPFLHDGGCLVVEGFPEAAHLPTLTQTFQVPSVTLDSVVEEHLPVGCPLVIKLDVEGAELEAIAGASSTLDSRDTLLIYEDHGRDDDCPVSSHLFDQGFAIFHHLGNETQRLRSIPELRSLKTNPGRGYNFFACRPNSRFISLSQS